MSGAKHYDEFFAKCRKLLKPDGVMLLHTIGKLGEVSAGPDPFTDKWIFPGYHLPSVSQMSEASEKARLIASDIENLRLHYALTLRHWLDRATKARAAIEAMYDARFFRMWEFYLAGGIVMFESGAACNYQVQYIRERPRFRSPAIIWSKPNGGIARSRPSPRRRSRAPDRAGKRSSLRALELGDQRAARGRFSPALPRSRRSKRRPSGCCDPS